MAANYSFPGVYVQEVPSGVRTIAGVSTSVAAIVGPTRSGPTAYPKRIASVSDFERTFGSLSRNLETGYAVRQFFANGGTDAWIVRIAKDADVARLETALKALAAVDPVNLLLLPGITDSARLEPAVRFCETRRAFLIADSPVSGATGSDPVGAMENAIRSGTVPLSDHAAIYFPWVRIPDPLQVGATRLAPPSGSVAGVFARIDGSRGVWKAPAGTEATLRGVSALACNVTDTDNGRLNTIGVNCLRTLPTYGTVVWGSRTLSGANSTNSEWKYVPVRRLGLFIEESLQRGTQWAVFEPNDEPLWSQLRSNVANFLHGLFLKGAFTGAKPEEAYFVKCDRSTMTQTDITNGIVNTLVGFAPTRPAEFVLLRIQLRAGQTH